MAVNIVLSVNGKAPIWREDTSIWLDDDAEYWYLWPRMIEAIRNQTGELIDLYDNATFSGQNLTILELAIQEQLNELSNENRTEWDIHVGTQTLAVKKEIYKKLVKKDLQFKLEKLLHIVYLAKATAEQVICLGD
jgi:hypothetical protein